MNLDTGVATVPQLHRALGTLDLVLLNVAAIVGLRWLSVAAQIGPSSLTLWALGLITFLVPSALTVLELSSRLPGEGGLYLWSKAAFGDLHGFIAGWSYWIANLVFFPSVLLFAAAVLLYVPGGSRSQTTRSTTVLSASVFYGSRHCSISSVSSARNGCRTQELQRYGWSARSSFAVACSLGTGSALRRPLLPLPFYRT
jgi:amino acid transporter